MHKAIRSFKVMGDDGKVRMVKPGEELPGAEKWKNLLSLIRRRWVTQFDGTPFTGIHITREQVAAQISVPAKAPRFKEKAEAKAKVTKKKRAKKVKEETKVSFELPEFSQIVSNPED